MRMLFTIIVLMALTGFAVPQKAHKPAADVPVEMVRAEQSLQAAKSELIHAGDEWGGHRMGAIQHVDAALNEIHKGMQWAKQHKDIK